MNPIAKAGWQFARLNTPRVVLGGASVNDNGDSDQVIEEIGGVYEALKAMFKSGKNKELRKGQYSKSLRNGKSWLRLNCPTKKKIGGTYRVKRIEISDEWAQMAGSPHESYDYGQEYDYTTQSVFNGDTLNISSGVAAYEPLIGGDENPWRQPIYYTETSLLAPDQEHYQEAPIGESFFPGPNIVYSRVKVRNLPKKDVHRTATGWVDYAYFTAKDFPTKTSQTPLQTKPKRTSPLLTFLKVKMKDYMTASEGFVVELNDMHGKPKSQQIFDEGGHLVSGVEYRYKTDIAGNLNNYATVIDPDGSLHPNTLIGVDWNMVSDARESSTNTFGAGIQANSDGFLASIVPVLTVVPLPTLTREETRYRSITTTKVIQRYGILDKTIAFEEGSSVETQNLAWDAETGEVLVTRTTNEFNDPIFSFNYPAHWAYPGMRGAYSNIGAKFILNFTGGSASNTQASMLNAGDELGEITGTGVKYWVLSTTGSNVFAVDINGNPATQGGAFKVLRSGRRNMPTQSIGSLTALNNPVGSGSVSVSKIVNAAATEYSEEWQTPCGLSADSCICFTNQGLVTEFVAMLNYVKNLDPVSTHLTDNQLVALAPFFSGIAFSSIKAQFGLSNTAPMFFQGNYNSSTHIWEIRLHYGAKFCTLKFFQTAPNFTTLERFVTIRPTTIDSVSCTPTGFDLVPQYLTVANAITIPNNNNFNGTAVENCLQFATCRKISESDCIAKVGEIVNPYQLGLRGNWRPKRSWAYLSDRERGLQAGTSPTNVRLDGAYANFSTFWKTPGSLDRWPIDSTQWQWVEETTRYSPHGNNLESRDPLNRHSAQLLGYLDQFAIAGAQNARYRQIAFDGFEDYKYEITNNTSGKCQKKRHLPLTFNTGQIDATQAHTGKYSLALGGNTGSVQAEVPVARNCVPSATTMPYQLRDCDCLGYFTPDTGRYVVSAWVKVQQPASVWSYDAVFIELKTGGQTFVFHTSGELIEGWQRIFGTFSIPPGATNLRVRLVGGVPATWYDDLRIHPFDASFKSYVYDDVNLRFTFELDENNYFTEYEYDLQGFLERVKKETERGVMTIQESRFGQQKQ